MHNTLNCEYTYIAHMKFNLNLTRLQNNSHEYRKIKIAATTLTWAGRDIIIRNYYQPGRPSAKAELIPGLMNIHST